MYTSGSRVLRRYGCEIFESKDDGSFSLQAQ